MTDREWFSAAEIAAANLPGLPSTKAGILLRAERLEWLRDDVKGSRWRDRCARGGGVEFHVSLLNTLQQAALAAQKLEPPRETSEALWRHYEKHKTTAKDEAARRVRVLAEVRELVARGASRIEAMAAVLPRHDVGSRQTFYSWEARVAHLHPSDWLAALTPRYVGAASSADMPDEAWEFLKADYLRLERPTFDACWRRLMSVAKERHWTLPSARTARRRLEDLPVALVTLQRDGVEALKRLVPAQVRDRGVFHALEAVNADGHRWDINVRWPDGSVGRPQMVVFQDLYSGKVLSWRVDATLHAGMVRLAFGDLIEAFGIPTDCYLDNGREFAAKSITGGTRTRYRFKVKPEDPVGVMTAMGVQVHWTTPYHGQSKPIERAFRDFAGDLAKHPAFHGAYVGNNVMNKPENYGSTAVPLEKFIAVAAEGIAEHNARAGRRTQVCQGRSFDAAFAESYAISPIRRATAEQRRAWLLASEGVLVQGDGTLRLLGNRYEAEALLAYRGRRVMVRFDPAFVQEDLHVYALDGLYIGAAPCVEAVGFNDAEAARQQARKVAKFVTAAREMRKAELSMTPADVAAALPRSGQAPAPETKIVRPVFGTRGANALAPAEEPDGHTEITRRFLSSVAQLRPRQIGGEDD